MAGSSGGVTVEARVAHRELAPVGASRVEFRRCVREAHQVVLGEGRCDVQVVRDLAIAADYVRVAADHHTVDAVALRSRAARIARGSNSGCVSVGAVLDRSQLRFGRARGRYFRENYAQGGVDLVQIIPELVTNADAIGASGRVSGRIVLAFTAPDPEFLTLWREQLRPLR